MRNRKNIVFPSYQSIYNKIKNQKSHTLAQELAKLSVNIHRLKNNFDFDDQHRKIMKNLIETYRKDNLENSDTKKEFQDLIIDTKNPNLSQKESLNELLENDEQQLNNYKNHLKFRKKVLERQLFQNKEQKGRVNRNKDTDDEQLFRNLYNNSKNEQRRQNRKESQIQKDSLLKNKKKLKESYAPYIELMANTHIMKWRILNERLSNQ